MEFGHDAFERVMNTATEQAEIKPEILECDRIPISFVSADDWEISLNSSTVEKVVSALQQHATNKYTGYQLSSVLEEFSDGAPNTNPDRTYPYSEKINEVMGWMNTLSQLER